MVIIHMIISFLIPTSTFVKIAKRYTTTLNYSSERIYNNIYDHLVPEYKERFDGFVTSCYKQMNVSRESLTDKEVYVIQALLLQYFLCP